MNRRLDTEASARLAVARAAAEATLEGLTQVRCWCPVLVVLLVGVAPPAALRAQIQAVSQADRAALGAVVQELDAARNARDAARFSAVFAEDGSLAFPVEGVALRGREEIRRHYATLFPALSPDR